MLTLDDPHKMREHYRLLNAAALGGLFVFVIAVIAEHVIVPELSPRQHTISEYANAREGWLMTVGFVGWSLSLGVSSALAIVGCDGVRRPWGRLVVGGLLAAAGVGVAITAGFHTQTVAGTLPAGTARSTAGRLHDLGSGAAQVALFGAVAASIVLDGATRRFRAFAAALLAFAVGLDAALLAFGDPAAGIRQRLLLAAAIAWHLVLLRVLRRRWSGVARPRQV